MKGYVYKRCPCGTVRDAEGRRINCRKKHGSWSYVHELPTAPRTDAGGRPPRAASPPSARPERADRGIDKVKRGGYVETQRLEGRGVPRPVACRQGDASVLDPALLPRAHRALPPPRHSAISAWSTSRDTDVERLYVCMRELGRTAEPERPRPARSSDFCRPAPDPAGPPVERRRIDASTPL